MKYYNLIDNVHLHLLHIIYTYTEENKNELQQPKTNADDERQGKSEDKRKKLLRIKKENILKESIIEITAITNKPFEKYERFK